MELDLFSAPLDHVTVGPKNVFNGQSTGGRIARVGRPWRGAAVDQLNDEASLINLGDYSTPKGEASLAKPRGGTRGGGGSGAGNSATGAHGGSGGGAVSVGSSGGALSTTAGGSLFGAAGDPVGGIAIPRAESRSAAATAPIISEPAVIASDRQEPRGAGARLSVGLGGDNTRIGAGGSGGANKPVVQGVDIARGGGASGGSGTGKPQLQGLDPSRSSVGASGGGGAGKYQMQGVHQPGALAAAAEEQAAAEEDAEAFDTDESEAGAEAADSGRADAAPNGAGQERGAAAGRRTSAEDGQPVAAPTDRSALSRRDAAPPGKWEAGDSLGADSRGGKRRGSSLPADGSAGGAAGGSGNGGGASGAGGASNSAGAASMWTTTGGGSQPADAPVHTQVHYQGLQVPDRFRDHRCASQICAPAPPPL